MFDFGYIFRPYERVCVAVYIFFSTHPKKIVPNTETSTIPYPTLRDMTLITPKINELYVCVCDRERPRDKRRRKRTREVSAKQSKREMEHSGRE